MLAEKNTDKLPAGLSQVPYKTNVILNLLCLFQLLIVFLLPWRLLLFWLIGILIILFVVHTEVSCRYVTL